MRTPEERYITDIQFHNLVDSLECFIEKTQFTPSELREAAILASIHYEQHIVNIWRTINLENFEGMI